MAVRTWLSADPVAPSARSHPPLELHLDQHGVIRDLVAGPKPPRHEQLATTVQLVDYLEVPASDSPEPSRSPKHYCLEPTGRGRHSGVSYELVEQLPHSNDVGSQAHQRRRCGAQLPDLQMDQAPGRTALLKAGQPSTGGEINGRPLGRTHLPRQLAGVVAHQHPCDREVRQGAGPHSLLAGQLPRILCSRASRSPNSTTGSPERTAGLATPSSANGAPKPASPPTLRASSQHTSASRSVDSDSTGHVRSGAPEDQDREARDSSGIRGVVASCSRVACTQLPRDERTDLGGDVDASVECGRRVHLSLATHGVR